MESIKTEVLDKLDDSLQQLLKIVPKQRAELHARVGDAIERQLDSTISGSLNDEAGHIRQWQIVRVGLHGSYAAVRPVGSKENAEIGRNRPGAKTNYLAVGHAVRKLSSKAKNYRTRTTMLRVRGRDFYKDTAAQAKQIATKKAKLWASKLAAQIAEGL